MTATTKGDGDVMVGTDMAVPSAAVVDEGRVATRKGAKTAIDAPRGPTTWLMFPEDICVAGVDYAADPADPFYDERVNLPLDPGLVDDIDQNGVIQPATVVKDGELVKGKDGRRRILHARAANKRRVERGEPARRMKVFLDTGDAKQVFLGARRANAYRLDDGILQKAKNAERSVTKFGSTLEEIAQAENTTVRSVKDWLAVLELGVDARNAIEAGLIAPSAALKLLKDVPRKEQAKVLSETLEKTGGKKVSTREAEAGAKNEKSKRRTKPDAPAAEPTEAAPTKRTQRKVILSHEGGDVLLFDETLQEKPLTDAFVLGLRWALGDVGRSRVKGLTGVLRSLGLV